jgi:hypothetical protein
MNVQLPVRMDKAAFLEWIQGREERYELDRGRVIMMTGGSRAHWQITANLFKALDAPDPVAGASGFGRPRLRQRASPQPLGRPHAAGTAS